ncbi:Amino Acid/Auxin Permease (AAAP) Family [Phytophthora cinnamomi]|uniref:Amino Acid/Auxin Permease (AAAP) Family n=1 Tax=Phytophthora cinnamomi TaxID=4785 RepID=UPI00355965AC|nr:Amino Acid/Auxin Permease (AAAP) Family [Phytophthora cinnamomi]
MGKPFFTMEDAKASFNLFCCVYGIGTLGMPGNFSRAGPAIAIVAMAFMAFANIYGAVAICRVMLLAPTSVKTYGDLGEWVMGKWGRYLTVIAQMGNCLIVPCVFLVLGGTLLDGLYPGAFSTTTWSILMALTVLPVCLVPTLKEGAGAAFAGCMGTLVADVIGIAVVMHGMRGHPTAPAPDLNFKQVVGAFGNLALAYGAGIVIPALQRQHSDPTRMPRVVFVTMAFTTCCFLVLASTAYSSVGCQISGNLLWSIYPQADTGLTTLGFSSDWGAIVLAYMFMQLHITIAFSVILNPAFYITERLFLGMHKRAPEDIENNLLSYAEAATPNDGADHPEKSRLSKRSFISVADNENVHLGEPEAEAAEYRGANAFKYVLLRISLVVILVIASVVLKDHFADLSDFVGASCITMHSIILPIVFLMKKQWDVMPIWEKVMAVTVTVVCFCLGCYVTYTSGENLFFPSDDGVEFPFCGPEYENTVYYNYTAVHES